MEVQQPPTKIPRLSEGEEEHERLIKLLEERLVRHDENRKAAQDKLHGICDGLRTQIDELEDKINKELEEKFTSEDSRLQAALNELRGNSIANALQKAKKELLVKQSYKILENKEAKLDLTTLYKLKTERRIALEVMAMGKPTNVCVAGVDRGRVSVQFTCLNPDEGRVLSEYDFMDPVKYKCLLFKKGNEQESREYSIDKNEGNDSFSFTFTPDILEAETSYGIRVKMFGDRESEWSDEIAEFTPEFKGCCVWKKCPDEVDDYMKYSLDGRNPRVATKINDYYCTIIGNTYIPLNTVTTWNVKVLKSKNNNGYGINIGVAPSDINQNDYDNYYECGWYFDCYDSVLWSGPPHSYRGQEYGPRKEKRGQYVHTGDSVGVVVDTIKGDLSFIVGNVNHGVAYEGILLDKPLVPCVILKHKGDSVELIA